MRARSNRGRSAVAGAVAVAIALAAGSARAGVAIEGADAGLPLVRGSEAVVVVTDGAGDAMSGETVRVIHRPGLAGERELAIGITDGRGRVRWTPELAGVARIRAGDASIPVRIVPNEQPVGTVVFLALILMAATAALGYGWWGPRRAPARTRSGS